MRDGRPDLGSGLYPGVCGKPKAGSQQEDNTQDRPVLPKEHLGCWGKSELDVEDKSEGCFSCTGVRSWRPKL